MREEYPSFGRANGKIGKAILHFSKERRTDRDVGSWPLLPGDQWLFGTRCWPQHPGAEPCLYSCSSWWDKGQCCLALIVEDILHHLCHLHFVLVVAKKPTPFSICTEGTLWIPQMPQSEDHHIFVALCILLKFYGNWCDIVSLPCQGFSFLSSWTLEGALFVVLLLQMSSAAFYIAVFHGLCQWIRSRLFFSPCAS